MWGIFCRRFLGFGREVLGVLLGFGLEREEVLLLVRGKLLFVVVFVFI
jgi:hypothetical protein